MIYIYKDRIIHIEWTILKGTSDVEEDFSRALVKCFLISGKNRYPIDATANGGILAMRNRDFLKGHTPLKPFM